MSIQVLELNIYPSVGVKHSDVYENKTFWSKCKSAQLDWSFVFFTKVGSTCIHQITGCHMKTVFCVFLCVCAYVWVWMCMRTYICVWQTFCPQLPNPAHPEVFMGCNITSNNIHCPYWLLAVTLDWWLWGPPLSFIQTGSTIFRSATGRLYSETSQWEPHLPQVNK